MGNYARSLSNRLRGRDTACPNVVERHARPDAERLRSAGIMRDGVLLDHGVQSHYALRAATSANRGANHAKSTPGDEEGFVTSTGRFVTRLEAVEIALESGQLRSWGGGRPLLSSDIDWGAGRP